MSPTKESRWLKILFGNLFPDVCFLLQYWSMWYIFITVLEYVVYIYYSAGECDIYLLQCWSMWYIFITVLEFVIYIYYSAGVCDYIYYSPGVCDIYLIQCWSMWYIFITVLEYVIYIFITVLEYVIYIYYSAGVCEVGWLNSPPPQSTSSGKKIYINDLPFNITFKLYKSFRYLLKINILLGKKEENFQKGGTWKWFF